jgi:hypothetical protein
MKTNRHAAFTLMELMISVALALMLILGINEVFGLTAQAVGAGQALSSAYQADRGTQIVMGRDFNNEVNTAPLLITSQWVNAFRSQADQAVNQSTDPDTYNPPGQSIVYPTNSLSPRVHRLDTVAFCARDLFLRQTGGVSGQFLTPSSSYEAYIWYGHLNVGNATMPLPSAWSTSTNPGVGTPVTGTAAPPATNPNNYYASQWVLGRMALLFQQTTPYASVNGVEWGSTSSSIITGIPVQSSGLDVVSGTAGASTNEGTIDAFTAAVYANDGAANWWGGTASSNMMNPKFLNYRFQCEPKPPRPLTTLTAAYYAPSFVSGCSQFCVEFAGDFVSQNAADGSPITSTPGPDGIIDFRIVNGTRQIMWYGLARNVVGDAQTNFNPKYNSSRPDVDSVQNIWSGTGALPAGTQTTGGIQAYSFEKTSLPNAADTANTANPENPTTYIAAWHPKETNNPRPKLIRITWAVDDPSNRLGLPVTFEYVFPVP